MYIISTVESVFIQTPSANNLPHSSLAFIDKQDYIQSSKYKKKTYQPINHHLAIELHSNALYVASCFQSYSPFIEPNHLSKASSWTKANWNIYTTFSKPSDFLKQGFLDDVVCELFEAVNDVDQQIDS